MRHSNDFAGRFENNEVECFLKYYEKTFTMDVVIYSGENKCTFCICMLSHTSLLII